MVCVLVDLEDKVEVSCVVRVCWGMLGRMVCSIGGVVS